MKKIVCKVLFVIFLSCSSAVYAAAVLVWDGSQYTGATGIDIGGALYDVEFVDGSCVSVFSGCDDASDFFFKTESESAVATSALFNAFFAAVLAADDGSVDANPELLRGCDLATFCIIRTPHGGSGVAVDAAQIGNLAYSLNNDDDVVVTGFQASGNSPADSLTYAVWSASTTTVPLPAAVWFFLSALGGLLGVARIGTMSKRMKQGNN